MSHKNQLTEAEKQVLARADLHEFASLGATDEDHTEFAVALIRRHGRNGAKALVTQVLAEVEDEISTNGDTP